MRTIFKFKDYLYKLTPFKIETTVYTPNGMFKSLILRNENSYKSEEYFVEEIDKGKIILKNSNGESYNFEGQKLISDQINEE